MLIPRTTRLPLWLVAAIALFVLALGAFLARRMVVGIVTTRIHRAAAERNLTASWRTLDVDLPSRVALTGLRLARAEGDTTFRADSLAVTLDLSTVLLMRPRLKAVRLAHARIRSAATAESDTLDPDAPPVRNGNRRAARVRRAAENLVRTLLVPARDLPSIELADVHVMSADADGEPGGVRIDQLRLRPSSRAARLNAQGTLLLERQAPFNLWLIYGADDNLRGRGRIELPGADGGEPQPLVVNVNGRIQQDRDDGVVRLDSTVVRIGRIPFTVSGAIGRRGPELSLRVSAERVTESLIKRSFPPDLLGPLAAVGVKGSFDYTVTLELDVAQPADVDFDADVVSRHLRLDPERTKLNLFGLDRPFTAEIHLPRGRMARRALAPANEHFRPLAAIDSILVHAVVTNEDGSFFRHRGFNTEAVKGAIAANLEAGAYRRGAGTITMQLARNLFLGHERTLSRKAQEVVLAWVLEHLTDVPKRRLLEVYLNIIEWGPGIHGADEACQYYFGHGAGHVTVSEALFLSSVVPSPLRWRGRFDSSGELRGYARAQMHFIGRAMVAKGTLAREELPPAEALRVELRGPARRVVFPDAGDELPPPRSIEARAPAPADEVGG